MKTYMIIYSSKNAQQIVNRIKTFSDYIRIKYRVWCIYSEIKSSTEVRERFKDILQQDDLLMILDISTSAWAAANLPSDVVYWLKER